MALDRIKSVLGSMEQEDTKWKQEFGFFQQDQLEIEEIEKDVSRLENYPIEKNPGEFCEKVVQFTDEDVVKFLRDELRELSELMTESENEKVYKRASEAEALIELVERLMEKAEEVYEDNIFQMSDQQKKNIKWLTMEMEEETHELNELGKKFEEMKNKAQQA